MRITLAIALAGAIIVLATGAGVFAATDSNSSQPGFGAGPRGPVPPSFDEVDTNKDGSISREEFTAFGAKRHTNLFKHLDANSDGVLDKDELQNAPNPPEQGKGRGPMPPEGSARASEMPPPPGHGRGFPPQSLDNLDTNKDGRVSLDEFLAGDQTRSQERFARMDANADGSLAKEEFENGRGGPPRMGRPDRDVQR